MRHSGHRKTNFIKDEFATAYDTGLWGEITSGTGAVSISSGELKLNTPANNDVAGLASDRPWYLRNIRIKCNVDVATSAPARSGIVLAKTQTTTANPETLNDSIRFYLDAVNSKYELKTDVGGTEKTAYTGSWTDGDGQLQLDIQPDGFFQLYEDTTLRRVGSIPLTDSATEDIFTLYIHLYALGLTGTLGYGLLDNFQLDFDESPTLISGSGVRRATMQNNTPVWGRLVDQSAQDLFETDHPYTDTPTQRVVLSRDVHKFQLTEIRAYMNSTNAVTSGFSLYGDAQADDIHSTSSMFYYQANTTISKTTPYLKTFKDTSMGATGVLERPGQIWFNQDWSGAPGDTTGMVVFIGKEVE